MNDETQSFAQEDITATKGLSALSYLGILFIIPLLVNKDSAYTKFHVNQGICVFLIAVVGSVLTTFLGAILGNIPFVGWVFQLILALVPLFSFVLMIIGIINAVQGKAKRLPIIGNIQLIK